MSSEHIITQIKVGRFTVGIIGLGAALEEAVMTDLPSDDAISRFLLDRLGEDNYFPPAAEERYARAFLREYRKRVGEPVKEEKLEVPEIRILGPGCPNCEKLMALVQQVLIDGDITADLDHVRDPFLLCG